MLPFGLVHSTSKKWGVECTPLVDTAFAEQVLLIVILPSLPPFMTKMEVDPSQSAATDYFQFFSDSYGFIGHFY